MILSQKDSKTMYVVRFFAILLVIGAHMTFSTAYPLAENIRIAVSQIGVIVFFISSGFFFHREKSDTKVFWKKKFKFVIVPWLLMASLTFVFSLVLNGNNGNILINYFKWVVGIGTWFWYVSVILIFYIIFKFIKHDAIMYICMILTIVSVLLSAFDVIPYNDIFNQYTNIFNWIGFFALGIIIRRYGLLEKIYSLKCFIPCFLLLILSVVLFVVSSQNEAYISYCSLPIELFGFVVVLFLSSLLYNSKILIDIGKKSFLIYLIHMQIAGFINTRLPYNTVMFILRPFIVLIVLYLFIKLMETILKKLNLLKYGYIVGLK